MTDGETPSATRGLSIRHQTDYGLVYERRGRGPAVVLLHGWCLDRRMWIYTEELLGGSHDVISVDLPGFGLAAGAAGPYTVERYSRAVAALLEELDITGTQVVGFAFGGAVAMTLAVDWPDRISGVVAVGIPSAKDFPADRMIRSMRRDWPDFARRSAQVLCPVPSSSATREWIERMYVGTRLHVAIEVARELGAFDPLPLASRMALPALFCHGADDEIVPPSVSQRCSAAASSAEFVLVPSCGHFVPLVAREAFDHSLTGFLRNQNAGSFNPGERG